jgi:electron transfer flavoprotein alpha subunit
LVEERGGAASAASVGRPWLLAAALGAQDRHEVNAVVIGAQTETLAAEGAPRCWQSGARGAPLLAHYTADGFRWLLQQFIQARSRTHVVFPHTYQVRDYAPALAAGWARC